MKSLQDQLFFVEFLYLFIDYHSCVTLPYTSKIKQKFFEMSFKYLAFGAVVAINFTLLLCILISTQWIRTDHLRVSMDTVNVRERGLFKTCIRGYGRTKTCIPYDDTFFGLNTYILVSRITCILALMLNIFGIIPIYVYTEYFQTKKRYLLLAALFSVFSLLFISCAVIWWICVVALDYQRREFNQIYSSGLGENTLGREWELGWAIYAGMALILGFIVQSGLFLKGYFDLKNDETEFPGVNAYEPYRRATIAHLERAENDKSSSYC